MNPELLPPRRRILFLTYLYPSFLGSGTQIRAAALVRMLAARGDVYLMVVNRYERLPGPTDPEMEALCRKIQYLRLVPDREKGDNWHEISTDVAWTKIPHMDCTTGNISGALKDFYDAHGLDSLFVFRIESYFLMEGSLNLFPRAYLDLDEFASRRNQLIDNLKSEAEGTGRDPARNRANAVIRIIEKKIIPRFEKVFVSSEREAREAREIHPDGRIHVLPNVFPHRTPQTAAPATQPREILFVGTLSYYPNEDAVRYFCRDIFPLIRRVLGDSVIFRIVGFGCPPGLREVGNEPGVELMGFQEDLDPWYARASLLVVPLRAGTGTRLKILEAFVHGRPVVSTSIGAEGLEVTDGVHLLLGDTPEAFARACLEMLEKPALAAELVKAGQQLHRESYSLDRLEKCYDATLG